jgi:hypothetical protein
MTSAARGDLIKIMCPDDLLPQGAIAELARVHEQNPAVGCIVSGCEFVDEQGRRTGSHSPHAEQLILSPPEADEFALTHGGCVNISTIAAARACWLAVGGVRQSKSNDFDLIARLQSRYKLALLPEPLVHIRRHSSQWGQDMVSAWSNVESDMEVIDSIARRALEAGQFTRREIDARMAQYAAKSHFLTVLHLVARGKPAEAIKIARIIRRYVPLNRVLRVWLKDQLVRKSAMMGSKSGNQAGP